MLSSRETFILVDSILSFEKSLNDDRFYRLKSFLNSEIYGTVELLLVTLTSTSNKRKGKELEGSSKRLKHF